MLATLGTIYKTQLGGNPKDTAPSFTVEGSGASVNLFVSQRGSEELPPANTSEMALDDGSPYTVGCYPMGANVRYAAWVTVAGTPVVRERGIILPPQ